MWRAGSIETTRPPVMSRSAGFFVGAGGVWARRAVRRRKASRICVPKREAVEVMRTRLLCAAGLWQRGGLRAAERCSAGQPRAAVPTRAVVSPRISKRFVCLPEPLPLLFHQQDFFCVVDFGEFNFNHLIHGGLDETTDEGGFDREF